MSNSTRNAKSNRTAMRMGIGERLRRVREQLNESQARFAERLGVAKLAVLNYESGESCLRADQLALLMASGIDASLVAFGVPSLATPQGRQQFAAALEWSRHEHAASGRRAATTSAKLTSSKRHGACSLLEFFINQQQPQQTSGRRRRRRPRRRRRHHEREAPAPIRERGSRFEFTRARDLR